MAERQLGLPRMKSFLKCTSISMLLILIVLLQLCLALYEDQVGQFDWRQQYVGKVKFAYFDQHTHSSRRALVATESNVIAALNARTGSIIWRKVFESKHGNVDALLHHANALISVSGYGKVLRAWDPSKGHLQWEAGKAQEEKAAKNKVAGFPGWGSLLVGKKAGYPSNGVVVLYEDVVYMYSVKDGAEMWNWRPNPESKEQSHKACLALHSYMDDIFVIMQKNDIFMEITVLNSQNGVVKSSNSIPAPWIGYNSTTCVIVGQKYVTCLNVEDSNIIVVDLQAKGIETSITPFSDVHFDMAGRTDHIITVFDDQFDRNEFTIRIPNTVQLLVKLNKETKKVEVLHQFSDSILLIASSTISKPIIISLEPRENDHKVRIYDLDDFQELTGLSQVIPKGGNHGKPEYGTVYTFIKKDSELGYRLLVGFEDHALCLIQQAGTVLWEREEALAGIAAVEMIELPASTSASKLELLHEEFASFPNGKMFHSGF